MKQHVVNVMRPTEAQGTRGQTQGKPLVVYLNCPCTIETLSGREVVQARTVFAEAIHRVELTADPSKPIFERDYLELIGSESMTATGQPRRLSIGFKNDKQQNGVMLSLLCGERTGG